MKNQETAKNLRIFSYLFLVLGIWDIVLLAMKGILGDYNTANMELPSSVSASLVSSVLTGFIVIGVIIALYKILLGVLGLRLVKDHSKWKLHRTLVNIAFVIEVIALVFMLLSAFSGSFDISSTLTQLSAVLCLWFTKKYAKQLIAEKE